MTIKRGEEFNCTRKAEALAMQDAGAEFQWEAYGDWNDGRFAFVDNSNKYRRSPECPMTFEGDDELVDSIAPGEVFSWHRAEEALAMQSRGVRFEFYSPLARHWIDEAAFDFLREDFIYRRAPEESFEDRCKEIEDRIGAAKHELLKNGSIMSARFEAPFVHLHETTRSGRATSDAIDVDGIRLYLKHRDLIESVL